MGRATLILDADVSALRRAMGEIPGITQRAQAVMTSQARRGGRERVAVDDGFAREHESISRRLARAREKAARDAAAKEREEARKTVQADAGFARERDSIHARLTGARVARERAAQREIDQLTRERRAAGEAAGSGAASAAEGIASAAHGEIQAARQTVADRTSAINTSLVQRGTSEAENAASRAMT